MTPFWSEVIAIVLGIVLADVVHALLLALGEAVQNLLRRY